MVADISIEESAESADPYILCPEELTDYPLDEIT